MWLVEGGSHRVIRGCAAVTGGRQAVELRVAKAGMFGCAGLRQLGGQPKGKRMPATDALGQALVATRWLIGTVAQGVVVGRRR